MEEPDSLTLHGLAAPWQHCHESFQAFLLFVWSANTSGKRLECYLGALPGKDRVERELFHRRRCFLLRFPSIRGLVLFHDLPFSNL